MEELAHAKPTLASPKRPSFKGAAIMDHKKMSNPHGRLNRRSFLDAAGTLAGGLAAWGLNEHGERCALAEQLNVPYGVAAAEPSSAIPNNAARSRPRVPRGRLAGESSLSINSRSR